MSKQSEQTGELKKRALLAKQRLKMGYWQNMTEEKAKMLSKMGLNYNSVQLVKDFQQKKVERDELKMTDCGAAQREEVFYERVCRLLDADEFALNPLGQLVEHEVYDRLDEEGKQRYILELSKKFREMKDRYYAERFKSC